MRSLRSRLEFTCRVVVFGLLGWLLGTSVIPTGGRRAETVAAADVASRLVAWTRAPLNVALHANLDATPAPWIVDWLAALAHSGHPLTWTGAPSALAVSAEALADPRGGARVDVAAPPGALVTVRDDASEIDSVRVSRLGGTVTTPVVVGRVIASLGGQSAVAAAPESAGVRAVVIVGGAGWEGKFIAAALEERGWPVIARFAVAPGVQVSEGQGGSTALDTSRVAAVIAVDTLLQGLGGAIERYVRSGGGLVLAGPAGLAPAAASMAPGALGPRTRPAVLPRDTIGLGATGFYPVKSLVPGALALERRSEGISIAARRVGAGRVIQVGYDDSWRWRMAGGPGSQVAHREWWSRLVAAAAYVPAGRSPPHDDGAAPLAAMIARIGPPRPLPAGTSGLGRVDRRIFMTLIMIFLLAEWASRRMRGLR